jgi:type IV pilus assembly protein PilW
MRLLICKSASRSWRPTFSKQSGFSLIELLVAMVISLLLLGAVLKLFLDINRTNSAMARTNAQMENARFATHVVGQDLLHAGFWNGYVPEYDDLTLVNPPSGFPAEFVVPAVCAAFGGWNAQYQDNLLRMPVQTFTGVPPGCAGVVTDWKPGTDVLVVRYAGRQEVAAPAADQAYFQASDCVGDQYAYVLVDGDSGVSGCGVLAEQRELVMHLYYVSNDNVLMRSVFGAIGPAWQAAQPLINGVEFMAVELGIDDRRPGGLPVDVDYSVGVEWDDPLDKVLPLNRADGVPDQYLRCPAGGCTWQQLINVVSAKLHFIVRNEVATPGYQDGKTYVLSDQVGFIPPVADRGFERHAYSSTLRLTNIAGRRETP